MPIQETMVPGKNDIRQAREYIRQRLAAEESMRGSLGAFMEEAAKRIVEIAYKYRVPPAMFRFSRNKELQEEADEVIRWLERQIMETAHRLSMLEWGNESQVETDSIFGKNHGKTFMQRNGIYCRRFKYELEGSIAAALIIGASKEKLLQSIKEHFKSPYTNPIFLQAMKEKSSATRLLSNGISYGAGRTNSMYTALEKLSTHAVSQGWMKHWGDMHEGAEGFYSFRGSSYPCATCDNMAGYHPISEYQGGWHLHCVCYFVFI